MRATHTVLAGAALLFLPHLRPANEFQSKRLDERLLKSASAWVQATDLGNHYHLANRSYRP
jgi:hypothetical protein